jgi:hypothetical protein
MVPNRVATGNNLDRVEKIPKFAQPIFTIGIYDPRSGFFGPTSRRASAYPNFHE